MGNAMYQFYRTNKSWDFVFFLHKVIYLQVLAIDFVLLANEFIPLAIEFVALAWKFNLNPNKIGSWSKHKNKM